MADWGSSQQGVGDAEGPSVGDPEGLAVGGELGDRLGISVGGMEGAAVGLAEGLAEGGKVAQIPQSRGQVEAWLKPDALHTISLVIPAGTTHEDGSLFA